MLTIRALALGAAFALIACNAADAPSATPGAAPSERPTPTPVPGATAGGIGGGSDPGTGGGIVIPIPGGPNDNPLFGNATYLQPVQALVNQRTVNVQLVRAIVNEDGTTTVDLRWWSGVAPCSALDHVDIVRDDLAKSVRLKVIEGSGAGDMACIDIAQLSATAVDLGALASGSWMVSAEGDAPPITLDVP